MASSWYVCISSHIRLLHSFSLTGARLDARTYTFAHPIWRTTNAARKQGAISPILPVFCRYYLCDVIMLIKLSMVWLWVTGITTLEVAIRRRKFCSGCANEHSQSVQDARTYQAGCANVVIDARTHAYCSLGLFLLTWINCNPSIASSLPYIHYKVWHSRRSLAMATYFHPTLYNEWNYLSMLR